MHSVAVSEPWADRIPDAIWRRLVERLGPLTPSTVEAADDATLRSCGLSAAKIRTLRAIAAAIASSRPSARRAWQNAGGRGPCCIDRSEGRWSLDGRHLFDVFPGHPDAFAAGDLALQEAARLAYGLTARPSASELVKLAENWRPWRTESRRQSPLGALQDREEAARRLGGREAECQRAEGETVRQAAAGRGVIAPGAQGDRSKGTGEIRSVRRLCETADGISLSD